MVLANAGRVTNGPVGMHPSVAPPTPIHAPPAKDGVSAFGTHQESLQQGRAFRPSSGKLRVVLDLRLGQRERLLGNDRGHRDFNPLLARALAARLVAHRQSPVPPDTAPQLLAGTGGDLAETRLPDIGGI